MLINMFDSILFMPSPTDTRTQYFRIHTLLVTNSADFFLVKGRMCRHESSEQSNLHDATLAHTTMQTVVSLRMPEYYSGRIPGKTHRLLMIEMYF